MHPRTVPALLVASLVVNLALAALVVAVREDVEAVRDRQRATDENVRRALSDLHEVKRDVGHVRAASGLVSFTAADPDVAASSCDGVVVRFRANLNRLPTGANVSLVVTPVEDLLAREPLAEPALALAAERVDGLGVRATATLADLRAYTYHWLVAGAVEEASQPTTLTLGRPEVGGHSMYDGATEGRPDQWVVTTLATPDTWSCARVASADVVVPSVGGEPDRYPMEPAAADGRWIAAKAYVPKAITGRGDWAIEFALKDGGVVRYAMSPAS